MSVRIVFSNLDHATAHAVAEITQASADIEPLAVGIDEYDEDRQLWSVSVYFDHSPKSGDINRLTQLAASALDIAPLAWSLEQVPDINWVQKSLEGLSPVEAGRFFVHGQHDRAVVPANSISIELEAGMAFGSGHHGTTKGCLTAFDRLLKQHCFSRVLDVGTGTGILAIAAAKVLKTRVTASDIDPVAVKQAAINAHHNGVGAYVKPLNSTGLNHPEIKAHGPFDLIFANILAHPLAAMALSIGAHAAPGALVILSGILPQQSVFVERAYRARGFVISRRYNIENWITLCLHL